MAEHARCAYVHKSSTNTKQSILIYYKYSLVGCLSSWYVCFLERTVLGSNPTRIIKIFIRLITLGDVQR